LKRRRPEHRPDLLAELLCRINDYGFIESPYRKVKDGRVMDYTLVTFPGHPFQNGRPVEVEVLERENAVWKRPANVGAV